MLKVSKATPYAAVGACLESDEQGVTIISTISTDGLLETAGAKCSDLLLRVNGESVMGAVHAAGCLHTHVALSRWRCLAQYLRDRSVSSSTGGAPRSRSRGDAGWRASKASRARPMYDFMCLCIATDTSAVRSPRQTSRVSSESVRSEL